MGLFSLFNLFTPKKDCRKYKPEDSAPPKYSSNSSFEKTFDSSYSVSQSVLASYEKDYRASQVNELSQTVLTNSAMKSVLLNRDVLVHDTHVFNEKLELEGSITNQRSSGRCWIFAATNIMRLALMKKYHLDSFELSQNFVFFFDKLEKANHFLEKVIELSPTESIDSRLMQTLVSYPVNDGGQWDMLVNIIEKYGVVPQSAYPETHHSSSSSELNWLVTKKLREFSITLCKMLQNGKSVDQARASKIGMINEIYKILAITLSEPPKTFTWEFRDKSGKYYCFENITPKAFYEEHVKGSMGSGEGVDGMISLVNDPRHPYYRTMTVQHLGNVVGGHKVTYINVPIDDMKEVSIKTIQAGNPVWFGCDVGQFFSKTGIMDLDVYNYNAAFTTDVVRNLTKAQRLEYKESLMTHAMVLTGVHLLENGGTVSASRWRVENSWGEDSGVNGFNVMSDSWFSEFTYQVVIDKAMLNGERLGKIVEMARAGDVIELPLWDPLGSLALI